MFRHVHIITAVAYTLLCLLFQPIKVESRSYNNGLVFYDLATRQAYLPPTVSVSRGRILSRVQYSEKGSIWSTFGQPCQCRGLQCECCTGVKVLQYKYDKKLCTNITYVPAKEEAVIDVRIADATTLKYGMTTRNPSPACLPLTLGVPTEACLHFTNIGLQGNNLNMCMDLVMRVGANSMMEMHFQCMRFGLDGLQYVDKDGNPVIPPSDAKTDDGEGVDDEGTDADADADEYYDEVNENDIAAQEEQQKPDTEKQDQELQAAVDVDDPEKQHELEANENVVEGEQQEVVGEENEEAETGEDDVKVDVADKEKEEVQPVYGESLSEVSENGEDDTNANEITTEGAQQEELVEEEEDAEDAEEEEKEGEDEDEETREEDNAHLITEKETESETTTTMANLLTTTTTTKTDHKDMQITTTEIPTTTIEGFDNDYDDNTAAYATTIVSHPATTTTTTTSTTTESTAPLNDNDTTSYGDNYTTQTIETHTTIDDDRTIDAAALPTENDLFTMSPTDELTDAPIGVTSPANDMLAMASYMQTATLASEPSPSTEAPRAVELSTVANSLARRRSKLISHLQRRRRL